MRTLVIDHPLVAHKLTRLRREETSSATFRLLAEELVTLLAYEATRDADALIEREQEMRLIENLMLALPDVPALGFELGLRYNVATFGIWGFALRTSRNLREALQRALRYLPLSTAYCQLAIFCDQHEYGISADTSAIPHHLRQFLLERDTATAINLFDELALSGLRMLRLEFQGKPPAHAERIEALSGIAPGYSSNSAASAARMQYSTPSGTRWANCGAISATGGSSPSPSRKASCTSIIRSSGKSFIGVATDVLKCLNSASICLKIQMSRYSPSGAIPPRRILILLSGIMDSSVISCISPRPLQVGQAPYGELNEKEFGAGSS